MLDLIIALNCIRVMKEYGTYHGEKIGRIKKVIPTLTSDVSGFPDSRVGEIIIYREYSEMGKPTGRATVESPLCQKDIDEQKRKDSLITTVRTISSVPMSYIEEIRI